MAAHPHSPPAAPAREASARAARRGGGSRWWIAGTGAGYVALQLLTVPLSMGLGWDETVYVSQVSRFVPAEFFSAPRSRGITLLAAPVAAATSATGALRLWFAVLSGLGLGLALLAWRRVRDTRTLALAGLLFAGLWVTEFYGPQAMPNLWVALSGLGAVGCYLTAARAPTARGPLLGLTSGTAVAALMRPGDAFFLVLPLAAALPLVAGRRRVAVGAALACGLLAGGAEWVAEAYLRFGGIAARLRLAGQNEGGLRPHWALGAELRSLDGPTLCRPCTVGWHHPLLSLWWPALPLLAAGGVLVRARAGARVAEALLPALCGLCVAVPYLFLIDYAAPRFLLPAYALLALPAADLLGRLTLRARSARRRWTAGVVPAVLAAQLLSQTAVAWHVAHAAAADHRNDAHVAAELRRLGLDGRCLLTGDDAEPLGYYTGCAAAETTGLDTSATPAGILRRAATEPTALLLHPGQPPPAFARGWRPHPVPGLPNHQGYTAYLAPPGG